MSTPEDERERESENAYHLAQAYQSCFHLAADMIFRISGPFEVASSHFPRSQAASSWAID